MFVYFRMILFCFENHLVGHTVIIIFKSIDFTHNSINAQKFYIKLKYDKLKLILS